MIKTLIVLVLVSAPALAMDCDSYYSYGSAAYAECQDRNRQARNQAAQASIDALSRQIAADDQARKVNTTIEDQSLIHPRAAVQMPGLGSDQSNGR